MDAVSCQLKQHFHLQCRSDVYASVLRKWKSTFESEALRMRDGFSFIFSFVLSSKKTSHYSSATYLPINIQLRQYYLISIFQYYDQSPVSLLVPSQTSCVSSRIIHPSPILLRYDSRKNLVEESYQIRCEAKLTQVTTREIISIYITYVRSEAKPVPFLNLGRSTRQRENTGK